MNEKERLTTARIKAYYLDLLRVLFVLFFLLFRVLDLDRLFNMSSFFTRKHTSKKTRFASKKNGLRDEDGCGGERLDTETENLRRNEPEVQTFDFNKQQRRKNRFGDSFNQR